MKQYSDIIHLNRPTSAHPRMRREDRAKIFAPFAALNGHGDAIHARDKVLVPQISMTEYAKSCLDEKLRMLRRGDQVTVSYFAAHKREGTELLGEYVSACDEVLGVDEVERRLRLRGLTIPFDCLQTIRIRDAAEQNEDE